MATRTLYVRPEIMATGTSSQAALAPSTPAGVLVIVTVRAADHAEVA